MENKNEENLTGCNSCLKRLPLTQMLHIGGVNMLTGWVVCGECWELIKKKFPSPFAKMEIIR